MNSEFGMRNSELSLCAHIRLPCVKGAAPKGLRDCLSHAPHNRSSASLLARPLGELSPQVTERARSR